MNCFYHVDINAVAICKSCNKGLCLQCAAEIENGIACRNRCEGQVQAINELMQRGKTAYQKTSGSYAQYAIFLALVGLLFIGYGVWDRKRGAAIYFVPFGLIMWLAAIFSYTTSLRFKRKEG
jgi:hypothetical protein